MRQKLNSAGLRATSPRVRVLEIFRREERLHLTEVAEFSDPAFEAQQRAIAETEGFVLGEQRLVLRGHCKGCCSPMKQSRKVESSPSRHGYNQG